MVNQVLTIEQMKHLTSLGLDTSNASMYWQSYKRFGPAGDVKEGWDIEITKEFIPNYTIPAYTLQDILSLILPIKLEGKEYFIVDNDYGVCIIKDYDYEPSVLYKHFDGNLLESAYNALLWCIENGYIETEKK